MYYLSASYTYNILFNYVLYTLMFYGIKAKFVNITESSEIDENLLLALLTEYSVKYSNSFTFFSKNQQN